MIWKDLVQNKLSSCTCADTADEPNAKNGNLHNTVNLKEAQKLTFEEEQNLEAAFYSASIALEAFSEDDDEKQPVVDTPRMDVQAMSTMEVIEVIQTNPEL